MREMLSPTGDCRNGTVKQRGADYRWAFFPEERGAHVSAMFRLKPQPVGPIGLLEEGDLIEINIPEGVLNVKLSEEELQKRRKAWKEPEPKIKEGYNYRYSRLVTSANTGAVLKY